MKRIFVMLIFVFALFGCSNSNTFEVKVERDLYFNEGNDSPFAIQVLEEGSPVTNLQIETVFNMVDMDHGSFDATLSEVEDGIYTGKVALPMAGDWEIVMTIVKDGKSIEKIINYTVKEADGLATINGEWITKEDIDFYRFINDLHIAINRENDINTYKDEELDEAMAYWDAQEKMNEDTNQLLTQIIRLRSMALLAEEKGHTASDQEIATEIEKVREQYGEYEVARELIGQFGHDKFWTIQERQYELIVLSTKVQQDIIERVREDNPDVNEQEIHYLAQKEYEELLVSQVNSLEIELM